MSDIPTVLDKIGALVKAKAIRLCPIDLGELRASINYRVEGNKVIIYTDLDYAEEMEYGRPPGPLSDEEKANLKDWAERHQLPPNAVIHKIETKGIEAGTVDHPFETKSHTYRPFLRPALFQSIPEIKTLVRSELG